MGDINIGDISGVVCWCCGQGVSINDLRENDGFCVDCGNEIDLEEPPYKIKTYNN